MGKLSSWVLAIILSTSSAISSPAQSKSAPAPPQSSTSLGDSLRNPAGKEIHIFYVHGIGSEGPKDRDSLALRKSICDYLKDCIVPGGGKQIGQWDYADQDEFQVDAPVPQLQYMEEQVWKSQEEWRAAAPYAVHFQIARTNGPSIYVDELNWWPLTFSLKCRQLIASDAAFVAPSKERIDTCSTREPDPGVAQRFKSYDWFSKEEAARLDKLPTHGARVNRQLKTGLMDWGFPDAVMALGPLRSYVLDGIRELILRSLRDTPGDASANPNQVRPDQEFVIVSHSLGSYLIFSALDVNQVTVKTPTSEELRGELSEILKRTPLVVFFANQLRLLELSGLDGPTDRNIATHLEDWGKARCEYLKSLPDALPECKRPMIIALNDPSDLLTWTVPPFPDIHVVNYSVKNSTRWLWLLESPTKAHSNYATDKRAIKEMLTTSDADTKK